MSWSELLQVAVASRPLQTASSIALPFAGSPLRQQLADDQVQARPIWPALLALAGQGLPAEQSERPSRAPTRPGPLSPSAESDAGAECREQTGGHHLGEWVQAALVLPGAGLQAGTCAVSAPLADCLGRPVFGAHILVYQVNASNTNL